MTEHSHLEIGMAEMKTDIKYIKESLIDNKEEHKELLTTIRGYVTHTESSLESKANKDELKDLSDKLNSRSIKILLYTIALLLSVLGFIIRYVFFQ